MITLKAEQLRGVLRTRRAESELIAWVNATLDGVPITDAPQRLGQVPRSIPLGSREKLLGAIFIAVVQAPLDEPTIGAMKACSDRLGIRGEWFGFRVRAELGISLRTLKALAVLGLGRDFTPAELKKSHRNHMKDYHPDKVAHLAPDFQKLATERTLVLNKARAALEKVEIGKMPVYDAGYGRLVPDYTELIGSHEDRPEPDPAPETAKPAAAAAPAPPRPKPKKKAVPGTDPELGEWELPPPPTPAPAPARAAPTDETEDEAASSDDEVDPHRAHDREKYVAFDGEQAGWEEDTSFKIPWKILGVLWVGLTAVSLCAAVGLWWLDPEFGFIGRQTETVKRAAENTLVDLSLIAEDLPDDLRDPEQSGRLSALRSRARDPGETAIIGRMLREDPDPVVRQEAYEIVVERWRDDIGDPVAHEGMIAEAVAWPDEDTSAEALALLRDEGTSLTGAATLLRHPDPKARLTGLELLKAMALRKDANREFEGILSDHITGEHHPDVKVSLEKALIDLHADQEDYEGIKVRRGVMKQSPELGGD